MIGGNVKTMPGAKVVGAIGLTGAIAGADDASGTKEAVRGGAAGGTVGTVVRIGMVVVVGPADENVGVVTLVLNVGPADASAGGAVGIVDWPSTTRARANRARARIIVKSHSVDANK